MGILFADGAESGRKWAVVQSLEGWLTCIWNFLWYVHYLLNMCSCFLFWISLTGSDCNTEVLYIKELAKYRCYILFNGHVNWFGKQCWVNSINFCFSFSSPFYPAIIITYFVIFMWIDDMILDVIKCTTITLLWCRRNAFKPRMEIKAHLFSELFLYLCLCLWIWLSSLLVLLQHASYFVWSCEFLNSQVLCWSLRSNSFFFFLVCFSRIFGIDFSAKILFSLHLVAIWHN